jgi:aminoglycoside phosphotransferase (APT) family kinase protein
MKTTPTLPDDPALPALAAIRTEGLAKLCPSLGLAGRPVELLLCGYSPGLRATLEARAGDRRVAVKVYAKDPAPEAELYETLAAAGLASNSGARVPPLLAWERGLRVLVIGWLEGPTAHELVKGRQGARAGELAASWLRRAASLRLCLGPPFGAVQMLENAEARVTALSAADATLGISARKLAGRLAGSLPKEHTPSLVHGTLYARHVLDLGDGPGVIDWQRFGQGPLELDAGMFLATIARVGLDHEELAGEAARAEEAFLAGTRSLLDERALGWYRATALLRLATRRARHPERHRPGRWLKQAQALLSEATRLAKPSAETRSRARHAFSR